MFAAQQFQAFEGGAGQCRWLAGGVDIRAGELDQALDQVLTAGHEGPGGAERFAQGANQHGHVVLAQAEMLDDAAAVGAQRAEAMGVIHHQPGPFGPGFTGQRGQVGKVAVHAEHTVGDHQGIAGGFLQALGQAARVVMQVAVETRTGQQAGIQQGRVVKPVFQYRIALPHQRRDRAEVGHVAGGEQQGTRATGQVSQSFFQLMVRCGVAHHQMRSATAHAPAGRTGAPGFDHLRVIGKAQVIVIAEGQQRLPVHHHMRALGALQQGALAVKMVGTAGSEARGEIERHAGLDLTGSTGSNGGAGMHSKGGYTTAL